MARKTVVVSVVPKIIWIQHLKARHERRSRPADPRSPCKGCHHSQEKSEDDLEEPAAPPLGPIVFNPPKQEEDRGKYPCAGESIDCEELSYRVPPSAVW